MQRHNCQSQGQLGPKRWFPWKNLCIQTPPLDSARQKVTTTHHGSVVLHIWTNKGGGGEDCVDPRGIFGPREETPEKKFKDNLLSV